jgi:uncharacterized protein YndB with AHSA1/START domain
VTSWILRKSRSQRARSRQARCWISLPPIRPDLCRVSLDAFRPCHLSRISLAMPSTSVSRVIAAPREQVWSVLSDLANARRWNSAWTSIEFVSGQTHGPDTRFRARTAEGESYEFVITAWVVPEYIEFTPVRDETERYSITLEAQAFRLEPEGEDATQVELIARASTHGLRGWLLGLAFWRGHQKQGLNTALERLQAALEPERSDEPHEGAASTAD